MLSPQTNFSRVQCPQTISSLAWKKAVVLEVLLPRTMWYSQIGSLFYSIKLLIDITVYKA